MGLSAWLLALPLILSTRAQRFDRPFDGIRHYEAGEVNAFLGGECNRALVAKIDCPEFVLAFTEPRYHESLQDADLADAICTDTCSDSLRTWFDDVTTACEGRTAVGSDTPARYGGFMWAGWNETCLRDTDSGLYCVDIMQNFANVDDVQQMPSDELCHPCHVSRLAMMQASPFSVYDESYKSRLEYVYAQCGGEGPTDVPPAID
jgi:hypothetical protein